MHLGEASLLWRLPVGGREIEGRVLTSVPSVPLQRTGLIFDLDCVARTDIIIVVALEPFFCVGRAEFMEKVYFTDEQCATGEEGELVDPFGEFQSLIVKSCF
jgi:hypothetical protein